MNCCSECQSRWVPLQRARKPGATIFIFACCSVHHRISWRNTPLTHISTSHTNTIQFQNLHCQNMASDSDTKNGRLRAVQWNNVQKQSEGNNPHAQQVCQESKCWRKKVVRQMHCAGDHLCFRCPYCSGLNGMNHQLFDIVLPDDNNGKTKMVS